jgi:hypothetical protein
MASDLYAKQVRIVEYPKLAEPFRDRWRENAGRLATVAGPRLSSPAGARTQLIEN